MRYSILFVVALLSISTVAFSEEVNVVTTLPDYATFAKAIGGERVTAKAIVQGNQDAHFIRPKPSFVNLVRRADLLISTGLDLELWLPTVVDKSGNRNVRSGQLGYVAATQGATLLEKPKTFSRSEGGVHIHGNPHLTCSPINMIVAAENIAIGLINVDRDGKAIYEEGLRKLITRFDNALFGEKLVTMFGGKTLRKMAEKDTLIPFLQEKTFKGAPLITSLGGWMKKMLPMRGMEVVTYHKNWVYFLELFGLKGIGTIEPKPGIPPSPRHVTELISTMKNRKIKIILAASYFDAQKVRSVAATVGAESVLVPMYVGGALGTDDYFMLVDYWINSLLTAAKNAGALSEVTHE